MQKHIHTYILYEWSKIIIIQIFLTECNLEIKFEEWPIGKNVWMHKKEMEILKNGKFSLLI